MNSSSVGSTTLNGMAGAVSMLGFGNIGNMEGTTSSVIVIPNNGGGTGTANVQYATAYQGSLSLGATAGANQQANVVYFEGLRVGSNSTANLVVQNAIGLHMPTNWAGTGATSATTAQNRYALLNEDLYTNIATGGNVYIGAPWPGAYGSVNTSTTNTQANLTVGQGGIYSLGNITMNGTGNLIMKAYQETVVSGAGTGGAITINVNNGTIQKLTLTSNITGLTFTNMPAGGSVTLIITQGGSGGYTLTTTGIKYAGGNSTLSPLPSSIDMLNILFDGTNYYGSLVNGYQ
jgi:hypothetical protein